MYKSIEANEAAIKDIQSELYSLDCLVQNAEEVVKASTRSIALWLAQPDSVEAREHMLSLCHIIEHHAFDVMNTVNATAEKFGANFSDDKDYEQRRRVRAAVFGSQSASGSET